LIILIVVVVVVVVDTGEVVEVEEKVEKVGEEVAREGKGMHQMRRGKIGSVHR
jgi:uncharacterized membrane protein YqgA involved in biofilm formation